MVLELKNKEEIREIYEALGKILRLMEEKTEKIVIPQEYTQIFFKESSISSKTQELLQLMGISQHIRGFYYLMEAIPYCYNNKERMLEISVTKELYPNIAKKYDTTAPRVERAIRHAIQKIVGDSKAIEKIKDNGLVFSMGKSGKVTNSEFIFVLVNYLSNPQ